MTHKSDDSRKSSHWLTLLVGAAAGALGGYFLHKAINSEEPVPAVTATPGPEIRSFLCPITQEMMKDPWACPHCQSFERKAIVDWLARSPTCPLCGHCITEQDLRPNLNLRSAIEEYVAHQSR